MANLRKRISELTALNSASLDTVIVGVDNGTTYKIELDVLADAVTSRVNILDRDRLQSLESVTSSFETKGRNVVSASAQITNLGFTTTSSFQSFSSSVHQRILDATNEQNLSNLATTGSNNFIGNQTISGSFIVSGSNIELKRDWPAVGTESHFLRLEPFTSSIGRYYDGLSVGVEHWDDGTGTYEHSLLIHSFDDDTVQNYGAELNVGPYRTHMRVYPSGSNGNLSNVSVQELSNGKTQALIYGDYVQIGAFSGQEILIGNNSASIIVSGSNMLLNTPLTSSYAISATSFNGTINATNGVISGSSQLTSSYDSRYVLNSKTASLATTGSNTFIGNQKITGSVSILIPGGTAYAMNENPTPNNEFWAYVVQYPDAQNVAVGWTAAIVGGSTYTVTAVNYQHPFNKITLSDGSLQMGYRIGINFSKSSKLWEFNSNGTLTGLPDGLVSGSSQFTSSYDSRYVISGSITQTTWDNIVNKPNDIVSSSTQISALGFVTGAYANITEFNSLTQSFNIISGSVVNITNAVDVTQLNNTTASLNLFTQSANTSISNLNNATSSYETKGSGIISGSSQLNGATITNLTITNLTTVNQTASVLYTSGSTTHGNSDSDIHSFTGSVRISGSVVVTGSISATSFNGTINSTNGVISGSSQLTSSYDARYTLSGSISAVPSGTISGSSQLTASYDARYLLSGSSTSRVFASDTAPSSPTQGDLWWKTDDGNLYVYYDSYWIVATDTISALPSGLISGSAQVTPAWTSAGAVTIGGTTTAPTKGTRTQDNISYRQLGAKQWEVVMTYFQTANTGAANGSGDYLFTLPNSLSFDMTIPSQTQYQSNIGTSSWYNATYVIPSGNGMISNGATGGKVFPVVYNSTQFRILAINDSAWVKWAGSGHFQFGDNPYVTIQLTFRFTSA